MGQKVHPTGVRVGLEILWDKKYIQQVLELE